MSEIVKVDASGLSCPQPVLLTKRALQKAENHLIEVLVDTATSRDNCARVAEKAGWHVAVEQRAEGGYKLVLSP